MAYGNYRGRRVYRRRLGGGYGGRVMAPFGRPLYPVPFKRKHPGNPGGNGAAIRQGRRVRRKYAGGVAAVRTKQQRRIGKVTSHGDNASSSMNMIGSKYGPRQVQSVARKIVQPQTVSSHSAGTSTCGYGVQKIENFAIMYKSSLTDMETKANGGTATNNSMRLFIKNGKFRLTMRNQSNHNVRMTIYDIVCKRDPPDATLDTPAEAWLKGFTDFGAATQPTLPGTTPFRSPEFRQYFAINRATTLSMEPGQQHDHTVIHNWNKLISSARFQNMVSTSCAGLTRFIMIVYHGSLMHESTTPGTVTYGSCTVDYAAYSEFSWGWISTAAPTYALTDNLAKTLVDADQMGESGDMDVNNNVA